MMMMMMMTKMMRMLLLVSSVALLLLLSQAGTSPTHKLAYRNRILDLVEKYNKSLTEAVFVEDVSILAEGCQDKFFCKVHDILHNNTHFGERMEEKAIVTNLKMLNKGMHRNCSEFLQGETSSGVESPIPELLHLLTSCVKKRNFTPVTL